MNHVKQLDWALVEAGRVRAKELRAEAAYNIGVSIRNAVVRLYRLATGPRKSEAASGQPNVIARCINAAKASSPLERGLRVGWY